MKTLQDYTAWPKHVCAPQEFRSVPNITGCHELDAVIEKGLAPGKTHNPDIMVRLNMYAGRGGGVYQERTGYNGYNPDEIDL